MRIKELREKNNLTQQEVADRLGMPLRTYQNYERGKNEPGARAIISFARVYNTSTDYLLGVCNDPLPSDTMASYEERLLERFMRLNDVGRQIILALTDVMTSSDNAFTTSLSALES